MADVFTEYKNAADKESFLKEKVVIGGRSMTKAQAIYLGFYRKWRNEGLHRKYDAPRPLEYMQAQVNDSLLIEVLKEEKARRQAEIKLATKHLYHVSKYPPEQFENGAEEEKVIHTMYSEEYVTALFALSTQKSVYTLQVAGCGGTMFNLDEEGTVCAIFHNKELFEKTKQERPYSYRYEIKDISPFVPVVSFDGRFGGEFYSEKDRVPAIIKENTAAMTVDDALREGHQVFFVKDFDEEKKIAEQVKDMSGPKALAFLLELYEQGKIEYYNGERNIEDKTLSINKGAIDEWKDKHLISSKNKNNVSSPFSCLAEGRD